MSAGQPEAVERDDRPAEKVAGFLAALAMTAGVLAIAYQPVKLGVPAIVIALVAAGMARGRFAPLARIAVLVATACWVARHDPGRPDRKPPLVMENIDGLNAGYARLLLDEYLENPEAVPEEWRELFEQGDSDLAASLPGLARLVEALRENGAAGPPAAPAVEPAPAPAAAPPRLRRPPQTRPSSPRLRPQRRSSAPTARRATSPPVSTRWARSPSAIRRSIPTAPCRA